MSEPRTPAVRPATEASAAGSPAAAGQPRARPPARRWRARVPPFTVLGWLVLAEAGFLISFVAWQPHPLGALLGVALLLALVGNLLLGPRRLRQVDSEWVLPVATHAGDETALGTRLLAPRGCPPFRIEAVDPWRDEPEVVAELPGLSGVPTRVTWPVRFPQRGLVALPALVAITEQPFGLTVARRPLGGPIEILVLPSLGTARRELRNRLNRWTEQMATGLDPGDDELAHLRPYRPGDPRHSIHWRASARYRALVVTERHTPTSRHLALVIDTDLRGQAAKRFERLVCIAATLVDHLAARGWALSLHGAFAPHGVHGARSQLLEALALVGPQAAEHPEGLAGFIPHQGTTLVLASREIDLPALRPAPLLLLLAECEELIRLPARLR